MLGSFEPTVSWKLSSGIFASTRAMKHEVAAKEAESISRKLFDRGITQLLHHASMTAAHRSHGVYSWQALCIHSFPKKTITLTKPNKENWLIWTRSPTPGNTRSASCSWSCRPNAQQACGYQARPFESASTSSVPKLDA